MSQEYSQAQLNSMAKRINTALVQYAKTFGENSEPYTKYKEQIINAIGVDQVHISKSGHIAISTGKKLYNRIKQLKELDKPINKVKGRMKEAEKMLQQQYKEQHPRSKKPHKFSKKAIKTQAIKNASIPNFFNSEITDFYSLRGEIPRIDEILNKLESEDRSKFSYTELLDMIDEMQDIIQEYRNKNTNTVLDNDEINEQLLKGRRL